MGLLNNIDKFSYGLSVGYVNYNTVNKDVSLEVSLSVDTVERFITEYDRITEEYFLLIFEEFLKTAHDFTTKKIKG